MWLKGLVMRAHYNGKIPRRSALGTLAPARTRLHSSCLASDKVDYHIGPNCKERKFFAERSGKAERLTEEELKQVMTHEFEDADHYCPRKIVNNLAQSRCTKVF